MKNKIRLKDLDIKDSNIIWNSEKNDDETNKVTVVFNHKTEIILQSVPGQYVKEDGDFKKKILNEKESVELIDRRMQALLAQLQQVIFTIKLYGGQIDGHISSGICNEEINTNDDNGSEGVQN